MRGLWIGKEAARVAFGSDEWGYLPFEQSELPKDVTTAKELALDLALRPKLRIYNVVIHLRLRRYE